MQITLANPGKAIIHVLQARNVLRDKYNSIASCKACDEALKARLLEGAEFFDSLLNEIRDATNEHS